MQKSPIAPVHTTSRSSSICDKSGRSVKHLHHSTSHASLFSWLDMEKMGKLNNSSSATASLSSERPGSQYSNFSGVSGHNGEAGDDEYLRTLRENLDSGNSSLDKKVNDANFHKIIYDLNNELLNAKTEIIQLKFKLDETKASVEMEWSDKVRRLSNENRAVLEQKINLEKVNEDLKGQLHKLRAQGNEHDLENLRSKVELLESERSKDEIELFQSRNYIQDLKIKLETKEKACQSLKQQIVDLHTKNQDLTLQLKRMENEISTGRNEMEMLKKSEAWYKNELHESQNRKLKLQEDVMNLKNELQVEKSKNTRLFTEFTQLLRNCEDIEARAVREKESMMRKLENIQANFGVNMDKNHLINHFRDASDRQEAIKLIDSLQEEISKLNHRSDQQETLIRQLEDNCKKLSTSEVTLKNRLSEANGIISTLEAQKKQLDDSLSHLKQENEDLINQNQHLISENERLTLHFESTAKEKAKIDETVEKLRTDFEVIMDRFKCLSEELTKKDKLISEITIDNQALLERLKETDDQLTNDLKNDIELLKADITTKDIQINKYTEQMCHLSRQLGQRDAEIIDLRNKVDIKTQEIELLTESNHLNRKEAAHMTGQLQNAYNEIKSKNEKINQLFNTMNHLEEQVKFLTKTREDLETKLVTLQLDNASMTEQCVQLLKERDNLAPQPLETKPPTWDKAVECDTTSSEIEILRADMEMMRIEYQDKLSESEANTKAVLKKLKDQNKLIKTTDDLAREKTELTLLNAEVQAKLDLTTAKCSMLEDRCKRFEANLDELERQQSDLVSILKQSDCWVEDSLYESLKKCASMYSSERAKLMDVEFKVRALKEEINRQQNETQKLKRTNETLMTTPLFAEEAPKISDLEAKLLELTSALESKEAQVEGLENEIHDLHEQIKTLSNQNDLLQLELATVSSQKVELDENSTDLKNRLHSSRLAISMLEERLESFKAVEQNLIQSKEKVVKEMQNIRNELVTEHEEKMQLQKLVTELKFSLSQLTEQKSSGSKVSISFSISYLLQTLYVLI